MNKYRLIVFLMIAGITSGYLISLIFTRTPIINEITDLHYCSCVKEQPHLAPRLLEATKEVNVLITQETDNYIRKNGLRRGDLYATFYPLENGYSKITIFCSNRTWKVKSLLKEYQELILYCDGSYSSIVREAHDLDPRTTDVNEAKEREN